MFHLPSPLPKGPESQNPLRSIGTAPVFLHAALAQSCRKLTLNTALFRILLPTAHFMPHYGLNFQASGIPLDGFHNQ